MCGILNRDTFYAPEVQIFVAVHNWIKKNADIVDINKVLSFVRLPLLTCDQLFDIVRPSGLVDQDKLLQSSIAIHKGLKDTCKYSYVLFIDLFITIFLLCSTTR